MDAIYTLARHILDMKYDRLPREVVEVTKKQVLDSFAVAIAGSAVSPVLELLDIYREWGGKKESTVWVHGDKIPAGGAAQINASMVHARDFDDTHDLAVLHPSVVAVPVAFALAERTGRVSGRELITAVALGVDLSSRLCLSCTANYYAGGWHFTPLHGFFSATAVAGKLLRLEEKQLVHAFGIAYHQTSGNLLCVDDGALTKRCGPGFANWNGIMAALMAQRGITGAQNVLESEHGLFQQYHRGAYNPERLTEDLGVRFEGVNVSFKPYPCCRYNHPGIDAAIALIREYKIGAEDIETVTAHIGSAAAGMLAEPREIKCNPRNAVDAQFSLPWALASTLLHGKFTVGDVLDEAIKDPRVIALSNRVSIVKEKDLSLPGIEPMVVDITTRGGQSYSKRVDTPYGSPRNPMSFDAVAAKLREAAPYAARKLTRAKVESLIECVSRLEEMEDSQGVIRLLTGAKAHSPAK
jgi:2-methylcitrate dehydratase PrpD